MIRLTLVAVLLPAIAAAGEARVVDAQAAREAGTWRFDVTVTHADEGWEHYADAWEVRSPAGDALGVRELLHPHETEQPFTRSLTGVDIGSDITQVEIRARDNMHGWGPPLMLELPW